MAVTAYLEVFPGSTFDPARGGRALFEAKSRLPPAWLLFFEASDFLSLTSKHDGSEYRVLRTGAQGAVARARGRLSALKPLLSEELEATLSSFVRAVEVACAPKGIRRAVGGEPTLVLNSHRYDAPRKQLEACARWFDEVIEHGVTKRLARRAEELFDPLDGLETADGVLDVADPDALCGWPLDAQWTPPEPPAPPLPDDASAGDLILARLWANPDDRALRLTCAKALTALRDPRGEFISIECGKDERAATWKRHDRLLERSRAQLSRPFTNARTFDRGLPLDVDWDGTTPPANHPAWSTVKCVRARTWFPALATVRVGCLAAPPEVLLAVDRPVSFTAVSLVHDELPGAFEALRSVERFPNLVAVFVDRAEVWLHQSAQQLVDERPTLHLRAGSADLSNPFAPMTEEEHRERVRRWANPGGPFLAGPRYDNGYR